MTLEEKEKNFKNQVYRMIAFPADILQEFFDYWSEPNKSGTKLRYELEKTWDLNRRLKRWQNGKKDQGFISKQPTIKKMEPQSTIKEIAELDQLLANYRQHPTEVPFTSLAKYYPYMKQEKLLKVFTKGEVNDIVKMFNNDQLKCRSYCVEQTLRSYADGNFTFSHIVNLRLKVA